jgi:hypothetical protein
MPKMVFLDREKKAISISVPDALLRKINFMAIKLGVLPTVLFLEIHEQCDGDITPEKLRFCLDCINTFICGTELSPRRRFILIDGGKQADFR